jgi:membrane protease YdiL (CAAX protease family)
MLNIDILKDILVLVFVYLPPLLVFGKIWIKKKRNKFLLILIGIVYLILSIITQNFIPFIFVLLNIKYLKGKDEVSGSFKNNYTYNFIANFNESNVGGDINRDYDRFNFSIKSFNIITAVKLAAISYAVTILISAIEIPVISKFKINASQQEVVTLMANMPLKQFLIMIPVIIIFAPILEEFVFRWLFFEKIFKTRIGLIFSAVVSSVMFAFIHFNLRAFPLLLWIALYNCFLIHKKGYWYSVFNHFTFNLITTAALLFEKLGMIK